SSSDAVSSILIRVTPTIAVFLHTVELSISFVTPFLQFGMTPAQAEAALAEIQNWTLSCK
ncbi:MAG: hypothetical protein KME18_00005, partial [Phormidium tanganyikae FI6-MK23]|nr:hypothetical protein [Phormidium tanganyikae FI6-MK23]